LFVLFRIVIIMFRFSIVDCIRAHGEERESATSPAGGDPQVDGVGTAPAVDPTAATMVSNLGDRQLPSYGGRACQPSGGISRACS
jgi:hypothetical protein